MDSNSIPYSDLLADLTARRNSLSARMASIDSAIDSIRSLLNEDVVPHAQSRNRFAGALTKRLPEKLAVEENRRSDDLTVYVNPFPEWSRAMAKVKTVKRKQNGIQCPRCGSCDTRRSLTRGFSDFLLFLFDFSKARCRSCDARFRVWRPKMQLRGKFRGSIAEAESNVT